MLSLSIDVGTTNLKAGVVDEKGNILALRRVRSPVFRPEQGAVEHPGQELWDLIISLSKDVSNKYKHEIKQIIISSYQLGLILLDEHFSPLTGMTLLSDLRARETIEELRELADWNKIYLRTGCPPMFQYPLARLFYFRKKRNDLFSKAKYFLSSKDYLIYLFTGELVTEASMAAATQLFNISEFKWDEECLSIAGVSEKSLPKVMDGFHTAIPVLESVRREIGLTSTTIDIIPGLYDGGALAVGLSGLKENIGVMNVGTSALVRAPGPKPVFDQSEDMRLHPYCLAQGLYLNGGALNNAASSINWLRDKVVPADLNDVPGLREKKGPPLFCLPYLTGERDAKIGAYASGVFFGLRDYHSKRDMLRAVMEGVAFSLYAVNEALENEGVKIDELRIGGGGAGSKIWTQIFADVFRRPIRVPKGEEVAIVGNAMIGLVAKNFYKSHEEAFDNMVQCTEVIEPTTEAIKVYSEYYEFFKTLRSDLGQIFIRHSKINQTNN